MEKQLPRLRKQRGLSQEALADLSGLSIRTIQRIEAGVSKPRAFTLKTLAEALEVELSELTRLDKSGSDASKDYRFVKWMNLSILGQLVLPLANIALPLIIWRKWRAEKSVKELGVGLISFQIWWTLGSLLLLIAAPLLCLA
ncbi:MAG: helix-turn-helix domain-containing protein, partial [Saprospiraceae bacterium]|nr:helix-turn-helix domain-containing protein [Saprospiraceae bacterium]